MKSLRPRINGAFLFMEKEIWMDITNYEGLYQVSNLGRIKSLYRVVPRGTNSITIKERILNPCPNERGYLTFALRKYQSKKTQKVHRIVALHFVFNNDDSMVVNHIDGNQLNNHYLNLEWVSQRENVCHNKIKTNKTSNYIGVSWDKINNKWIAAIKFNKIAINLGRFNTEEEAYNARCDFERENGIINKYNAIQNFNPLKITYL